MGDNTGQLLENPLKPLPPHRWNRGAAVHLLNRAGFGGTPEEIERFTAMGLKAAVQELIHPDQTPYDAPSPSWVRIAEEQAGVPVSRLTPEQRLARRQAEAQRLSDLRAWWIERMIHSPRPLEEKMTLFWHSHFATQADKVASPLLMYRQNELLRRHALDFLGVLVLAVSRDPAMVRFLDLETSQKDRPNDNFARELMELYTLGEGNYSETDIREAARAFTGATIKEGRYHFDETRHDHGVKTVLGRSGEWNGQDIINILLEQEAMQRFVPRKLVEFFAHPDPGEDVLVALGARFHEVYYDVRELLSALFMSEWFYTSKTRQARIKSPVEYVVGAYRQFGVEQPSPTVTALALRRMGQELFNPPDVDGWKEGAAWINTHTMMMRYHFARFFTTGEIVEGLRERAGDAYRRAGDPETHASLVHARSLIEELDYRRPGICADALAQRIYRRALTPGERMKWVEYLQTSSSGATVMFNLNNRMSVGRVNSAVYLMMCSPEYQVC